MPTSDTVLLTTIGLALITTDDLKCGLSFENYEYLRSQYKLNKSEFAQLIRVSITTAQRRKHQGKLNFRESELLVIYAKLLNAALDLMDGKLELALEWLNMPAYALGDESPLHNSVTSAGAEEVLLLIDKISNGSCI